MPQRRNRVITLIAIFKLLKATLLVLAGLAALKLLDHGAEHQLRTWISNTPMITGSRQAGKLLSHLTRLPPERLEALGIVLFAYAALFMAEGIGLLLQKRWAEYLTVIATGSLIPIEVYELLKEFTPLRITMLVVNIAVVAYLIVKLKQGGKDNESAPRRAR
ncbi:MAG: DUF2127 domain-containing protein [Acidobacteriota bacterium]